MPSTRTVLRAGLLTGLAIASPQQIDFNEIAAAPTVAVGPVVTGAPDQTATLLTGFSVNPVTAKSTASLAARDNSRRQSNNNFNTAYDASFGSQSKLTTIPSGQVNWLSGGSTHNIFGNINNYGSLVVSQTTYLKSNPYAGGQTCDWVGHDANNGNLQNFAGGLISINDVGSASAPTYDWYLHSIQNSGTLQWCGRGDTGGSTFQLYSDLDGTNNGLISFEQTRSNIGASFVWRNAIIGSNAPANLYNNGAFRLINTVFHNVQNIYGNGCWQIGTGAVLYLEDGSGVFQNPTAGPTFPGQSIIFQDPSAVLHMDTAVYSRNSNFGPQLYGFANGNAIEFYEIIKSFSYSSSNGVLTVKMVSGYSCNIKLGTGYDASKFVNQRNPTKYNVAGYNAIFYKGPSPAQSAPASCSISAPACGNLGANPPGTGSTSSSSAIVPTSKQSSTILSSTSLSSSSTALSSTVPTSTAAVSSTTQQTSTSASSSSVPASTSAVSSTTQQASTSASSSTVQISSTSAASSTAPSSSAPISSSAPTSASPATTTGTYTPYTPYYPALSTSTGTDGTPTTTYSSTTACPTTPEDGTYCGFINPEDPCAPQPDGYGPVPTPDTASAFLAYPPFHSMASAAPTVIASTGNTQYTQSFRDLNASSSANSFIQLLTIKSYDASYCAAQCDQTNLCTAFNIYIERDPSRNPTNNDSTAPTIWGYDCPNPASMTTYKCTLWGSELDASTATNQGQYREQFQVVITGSNGYDKTNITTPQQPSSPASLTSPVNTATGTASATSVAQSTASTSSIAQSTATSSTSAIASSSIASSSAAPSGSVASTFGTSSSLITSSSSSPSSSSSSAAAPTSTKSPSGPLDPRHPWQPGHNCHGKGIDAPNAHLGSHFFPGPFNPQVCSDYALSQNAANKAAAQSQGLNSYSACQFFNAQYLHRNGKPHGTYCRLFTTALDDSWATFQRTQDSFGALFECRQSWTWELTVHDSGRC